VIAYEIKEGEEISLVSEPGGELIKMRRKYQRVPSFLSLLFIMLIFPILVRFLRALL